MAVHLYVAPAGAGKTRYVLDLVRQACTWLDCTARVVLPSHLQVRSWRRRLAEAGGAIGVRLLTFDRLYAECLAAAGEVYTELSEPVQYRLIRSVLDTLPLVHYAPLRSRPGMVQVVQRMIAEVKAARISAEELARAVDEMGGEPRLAELARIYVEYQAQLQAHGWADRAGLGWLAVEAVQARRPDVGRDWPLVVVDGFDSLSRVQLDMVRTLAGRVGRLEITLTGTADSGLRPLAHKRFAHTRRQVEEALGISGEPLPASTDARAGALDHLEAGLFAGQPGTVDAAGAVELIEATDRAGEVRAALRWLKARLIEDHLSPRHAALLARAVAPYRPFIVQTAAEFGVPIRLVDGMPLRSNPAVNALLAVVRLMLPRGAADPAPALPRRPVIEAWRSPYLDWSALTIENGDADALDAAARWGRVVGGPAQWREALHRLAAHTGESPDDEERGLPGSVPRGAAAGTLLVKFEAFAARLAPPDGEHSYRDWTAWLERLIGPDPQLAPAEGGADGPGESLNIVSRARAAGPELAERDVAALQALKDVLRGLVWAEEAIQGSQPVGLPRFYEELVGTVEAATYYLPIDAARDEVIVADVVQARGVPFSAVAVLGLAEGELPATLAEDPFLRDSDRQTLADRFGLPLELPTDSAEAEFFYEAITRPSRSLLLTRPRLADNGAPWEASPYWEEVRRLIDVTPAYVTGDGLPTPDRAASWPELLEALAAHPDHVAALNWARAGDPARYAALEAGVAVLHARRRRPAGPFDGELAALVGPIGQRYGPGRLWSATALETYRLCPFMFFVSRVLGLEPRPEPGEGLDGRQLGIIYHHVLAQLYQAVGDPTDLDALLAALPAAAGPVLDRAPEQAGFRETRWWSETRAEIVDRVRQSVIAMSGLAGDYRPLGHELAFGMADRPALVLRDGDDRLRLRGSIDRVDRAPDGSLRIVDYKTSGPAAYGPRDIAEGRKLQLPLYALAARDALRLGQPAEGFYWHVQQSEPSGFTLAGFEGGPVAAFDAAAGHAWQAVRAVRNADFVPHPPPGDCPGYCPAAAFCWHYRPRAES